ncbi:small CPxCG-related zinc finger protein [Natronomonas moolapensis 8.8.11]|uniref:Small CPxCG-related zinc finger protein n=1 Tax=Natronomonas moolapensis (strain DSM 18674 / CECT 7526 / JCM 14361 / 8.8.11) TaxID=268739 RepID=M1XLE6_NATM8|nr:small CPxCG-related zinc finger protein [Natronomonas moolapensis 8.8.11]
MSVDTRHRCLQCGFEASPDDDAWGTIQHPPLGALTQCPECGSTDTMTR